MFALKRAQADAAIEILELLISDLKDDLNHGHYDSSDWAIFKGQISNAEDTIETLEGVWL